MSRRPVWRPAFDRFERMVGSPLESLVAGRVFIDVVVVATKVQRYAERRLDETAERTLRLVNVPAASQVERLALQLARVERELVELVEHANAEDSGSGAARKAHVGF